MDRRWKAPAPANRFRLAAALVQRNETPFFWQNYLEVGAVDHDNLTHAKVLERGY